MRLTSQLDRYLAVRRRLGYDLSTSERILRRFTRFADRECATHIDTALFLRWHATLGEANGMTRAARLTVVRLFAQWLSSFCATTIVMSGRRQLGCPVFGCWPVAAATANDN